MGIKNDVVTLIVGNAGSGKSFLAAMICEYYLLENKKCVIIDTSNDETILYRITNSYNLINRGFSLTNIKNDTLDGILSSISSIKNSWL